MWLWVHFLGSKLPHQQFYIIHNEKMIWQIFLQGNLHMKQGLWNLQMKTLFLSIGKLYLEEILSFSGWGNLFPLPSSWFRHLLWKEKDKCWPQTLMLKQEEIKFENFKQSWNLRKLYKHSNWEKIVDQVSSLKGIERTLDVYYLLISPCSNQFWRGL